MYQRLLNLPLNQTFLLLGPRATGKSTLLKTVFSPAQTLWIDLLDPAQEDRLARNPSDLIAQVEALPEEITHVVIDEIQKLPRLLDVVHLLVERTNRKFGMTGSSARKLKYGSANLLAGRAFMYSLNALTHRELGDDFDLSRGLQFGMLPKIWQFDDDDQRRQFLESYALTYLKEEIWAEQLVRKLDPFRKFLEVAAQSNGKIINFSNIARDVGVDDKTVREYYSILEDTLIGYFVESHETSLRKRLSKKPKFYFFDMGVVRSLARHLSLPLQPQTSAYGEAFEHFIIMECIKLAQYARRDFRFSYLRTKDDADIDLIVDRPGKPLLLIEIKSATTVTKESIARFSRLATELAPCEAICICDEPQAKRYDNVLVLPFRDALAEYFL